MGLFILLPILITLAFAVVLSNQLLQAAGVKSSIKFWTNIKSKFLVWYEHNELVQKFFKPIGGLFNKPTTSMVQSLKGTSSDSRVNVATPIGLKPNSPQS